ncbi:MAG: hypothetical protein K6E63_10535 [Lachnospiraceae bacterium]|nr:hypothetical protein [Lachnospiraceae bacterium]
MVVAKLRDSVGRSVSNLYNDFDDLQRDVFSRNTCIIYMISFHIFGSCYEERKSSLRDIAVEFSHFDSDGLSYSELLTISSWFQKMGRKYGLMNEFIENGII